MTWLHHLGFTTLFLQVALIYSLLDYFLGGLTDVELGANLHLHRGYSLMLFLVGLGSCLSLVGATLGTHYLTGCHQVSGTFLKIVDSGLFLVGFFSLLKSSTFAHLRVISIGCRSSLLLHLCRHHPLMTFLVIKVDRTINNLLTLVMKETLDRPLVYYFFILVNGCIEESFIVFHF